MKLGGLFDLDKLKERLEILKKETLEASFYDDIKRSSEINIEISNIEKTINSFESLQERINVNIELFELVDENEIKDLKTTIENLETEVFLNDKYDSLNCFLEIHAGAGGTESMDWSDILRRMYIRFCEKYNFKYEEIDVSLGEEAGIKSCLIKIIGHNAFGYLKHESGTHRLVRKSPFDSNSRRHTSFSSVTITPEFKKVEEVEINENDLKIDVFHSSGAGGQSVNTSNSAVRITHLPTKIVVSVQNERSQLKNKELAMNILKSKLFAIKLQTQEEKISGFKNYGDNSFGSQIRSYVLEPYKLVKDYRSGYESTDPDKLLNGDIKEMLDFNLKNIK